MYMASRSAAAVAASTSNSSYEKYVNPHWVNLLNIQDMNFPVFPILFSGLGLAQESDNIITGS
jgi:hypothetical protein